jgi:hypothetical protein
VGTGCGRHHTSGWIDVVPEDVDSSGFPWRLRVAKPLSPKEESGLVSGTAPRECRASDWPRDSQQGGPRTDSFPPRPRRMGSARCRRPRCGSPLPKNAPRSITPPRHRVRPAPAGRRSCQLVQPHGPSAVAGSQSPSAHRIVRPVGLTLWLQGAAAGRACVLPFGRKWGETTPRPVTWSEKRA